MVRDFVREAEQAARTLAFKNNNTFEVAGAVPPGEMLADAPKFRQSLMNLLSNACKFTENGRVTQKVERCGRDEKDSHAGSGGVGGRD